MATVERSTTIDAPAEQVFAYVDARENLPEIWPSMVEVTDVQALPDGGKRLRWTYKMAGMRFDGASADVEWVANRRLVTRSTGGIDSTVTWTFEPAEGTTRVRFRADYRVPVPLLGRLAEPFIVRQNEHEAETLLANLKARMEGV